MTIADANKDTTNESIEVLRNKEIIVNTYLQALRNANKWDYFAEIKSLSIVPFAIESLKKALIDARSRGIRIRFVTEITKDNIYRCKDAMKIAELRHLDGVRGNFAVSDTEYIATTTASGAESPSITIPYAIYSNVKKDIRLQHYIFEILWNKAIPAEQKIRAIQEGTDIEKTEVLYGTHNVIDTELRFFSEAKTRIDTCMDYTRPPLAIGIEPIRKSFVEAKSKGVKLRYLTEITNENISSCKEIMKIVDELRHLDDIKGNFMISESQHLAPTGSHQKTKPADIIVFSNVKEIVEHQQYVFDTFWNKAIRAEQKIKEIEEGTIHYETKILDDPEEIIKEIGLLTARSNELYSCLTSGGMQYSYNYFFEIKKKLLEKEKRGEHKGIRYISNIGKEDARLAKIFLDAGIQVRHIKNLPPMSFDVSDKEIAATIEKMERGKKVQSLLLSNEPSYVTHFYSIFQELWKNGIDAKDRLKDIEEGVDSDIEVVPNAATARGLYLDLITNARGEVMLMFPTSNAFIRQEKMGVIQSLKNAADRGNVKARILMPADTLTKGIVRDLKQNYHNNIVIRYFQQASGTKATILVVDRRISLVMELRDDSKTTFDEAIGQSTYSHSKAGVLSYVAIFENLWAQTELYEQVKQASERLEFANEQLRDRDKIQNEFINIAAHELRTPVQPILGLCEVLRSKRIESPEQHDEILDTIIRNAKRLHRLTEDILDITKIESQSLILNKERLNLNDVIASAIQDFKNQIDVSSGLRVLYEWEWDDIIFLEADRYRLTQVVTNLVSNAVKFVKGYNRTISINIEKKEDVDGGQEAALVSVKDNGTGIDADIFPRLFEKFASKSFKGTGLGLFISKNIVEAHGGKIWAENNADGKGATFSFSLPLNN